MLKTSFFVSNCNCSILYKSQMGAAEKEAHNLDLFSESCIKIQRLEHQHGCHREPCGLGLIVAKNIF